jgi:hypothetical protein
MIRLLFHLSSIIVDIDAIFIWILTILSRATSLMRAAISSQMQLGATRNRSPPSCDLVHAGNASNSSLVVVRLPHYFAVVKNFSFVPSMASFLLWNCACQLGASSAALHIPAMAVLRVVVHVQIHFIPAGVNVSVAASHSITCALYPNLAETGSINTHHFYLNIITYCLGAAWLRWLVSIPFLFCLKKLCFLPEPWGYSDC